MPMPTLAVHMPITFIAVQPSSYLPLPLPLLTEPLSSAAVAAAAAAAAAAAEDVTHMANCPTS